MNLAISTTYPANRAPVRAGVVIYLDGKRIVARHHSSNMLGSQWYDMATVTPIPRSSSVGVKAMRRLVTAAQGVPVL